MRIGILTFPNSSSHGASLQMYALYQILRLLGHDPEIINYMSDNVIHQRIPTHKKTNFKTHLKQLFASLFVKDSKALFQSFENKLVKYPNKTITTSKELREIASRYDRIIVGSDQVWNPTITGNDTNMFLSFASDNSQKAAYAPSFGTTILPKGFYDEVSKLLKDFQYLSAREKQGADLIKELTGLDVPVVVDPTMLIKRESWTELAGQTHFGYKKYVLLYTIKSSGTLKKYAEEFAKKHKLKLIKVGGRLREFINPFQHCVSGIGPVEFVKLVNDADYVFTNSFHGTAFSIIMHKNFYVEYSSDTNSRLENIINTFQLEDRVIHSGKVKNNTINFQRVDEILASEREYALSFLRSIERRVYE